MWIGTGATKTVYFDVIEWLSAQIILNLPEISPLLDQVRLWINRVYRGETECPTLESCGFVLPRFIRAM